MRRWIAALLLISVPIHAIPSNPSRVNLEESKSSVEFFAVGKPGFLKIHGEVPEDKKDGKPLRGELRIDEQSLQGEARFRLNVLDTGIALRNRHMKEKYLETTKWPDAEIVDIKIKLPVNSQDKEEISMENLSFEGLLSLHGKKKPVIGKASVNLSTNQLELNCEFKIKVTDFGIELPSFMGVTVVDDVTVKISILSLIPRNAGANPLHS